MSGRKLAVVVVILCVFFISRANSRGQRAHKLTVQQQSDATGDTGRFVPAVDEGLGAAVAILIDNSGSMRDAPKASGETRPKYVIAREALDHMLAATDSFVAKQAGLPVKVGLFVFSSQVQTLLPIQPYDRDSVRLALSTMELPSGGTAIGEAMDAARAALYRAGVIRKYILVLTDGENTEGRSPAEIAPEIARRSEGAVKMYFVAFDVAADKFSFVRNVRGEVLGAGNALALRASLDTIYRGKILAEAVDAGEGRAPSPPPSPSTTRR